MVDPTPAPAAHRATSLVASAIRDVWLRAEQRPGCLRLEVGEPDFSTPPWVTEAAHRAAAGGATRYTSNSGIGPLREALTDKLAARNGYRVGADQLVIGAGGVQVLHLAFAALADPGDEVLIPDPSWPNFRMICHLVGARPIDYPLRPEAGWRPTLADLNALVTDRTRILLVNAPSNPVGSVLGAEHLAELAGWCARRGIWLVSDECYDELVFDGPVVSAAAVSDYERILGIYSFSKVYAMTGWRVGYAVGPAATMAQLAKLQEPLVSCVNTPAQHAALAALTGPQEVVGEMVAAYRRRRDGFVAAACAEGLALPRPEGAFYAWVDVSAAGLGSIELTRRLVDEAGVAVAPGAAFGPLGEGRVRVSLASAEADLIEAAKRLGRFVASCAPGVAELAR